MALSLPVPTEFGIDATYHRIATVQANWADGGCSILLYSYIDQASRAAGAKPLGSVQIVLNEALSGDDDATRAALYARIKSEDAWIAATDI